MSNENKLSDMATRLLLIIKWRYPYRGAFNKLEEETGISKSTWSSYNTGRNNPSGESLEAICKLYPQYAYWLMTGRTDPEHGHTSPDIEQLEELRIRVGK